jgi:hypothetical protein
MFTYAIWLAIFYLRLWNYSKLQMFSQLEYLHHVLSRMIFDYTIIVIPTKPCIMITETDECTSSKILTNFTYIILLVRPEVHATLCVKDCVLQGFDACSYEDPFSRWRWRQRRSFKILVSTSIFRTTQISIPGDNNPILLLVSSFVSQLRCKWIDYSISGDNCEWMILY